ncbi:MAG: small subunit ribosomal protein [Candidatus Eremiobacteraeota bacterium]|jgi:small subunit ribosomal protein S4|nr:small subunit ribosomal protein [Candidatus Eremiobacteraeota bacterium]MEA2721633.1 small subunit ribosomal protein [Candidatus Eremiobacteraeota bacterium]
MARYTEAVCRLCRRETATSKTGEKIKLFLKGDRCLSKKCAVERRGTAPGQKTQNTKTRQKISEYGRQLREKQKMRRYYGVLETQFSNYFRQAQRVKGQTGATFLQFLERRLDNVIYRLNLAQSRPQARQLVTHRHFRLNGRLVNVPSIIVKAGDVISITERSGKSDLLIANIETAKNRRHPEWLEFNETDATARVLALPSREQIDTPVDEQLIVEYYSR